MAGDKYPVIVLGVDGSAGSAQALRWAVEQALLTGAAIRAVTAWEVPVTFGYAATFEDVDLAAEASKALDRVVNEVVGADRPGSRRHPGGPGSSSGHAAGR